MKTENQSDYDKALNRIRETITQQFYLGQEVKTEFGKGIVVSFKMYFNGLYTSPETSIAVVWFSTSGSKDGWVSKEFRLSELKTNYKNRKEKLLKIKKLL